MNAVSLRGTGTDPAGGSGVAHAAVPAPARTGSWPILIAIVAVGVVLRAIGLNSGLWQDEVYALVETIRPSLLRIVSTYPADTHHPLYSVLAHMSIGVFGEAPWTARLPALLFGVATIPALYALGRRVGTRTEALLACMVLAVSYHHVWFSQNARGYTALAFFAVLCAYFLLRGIEDGRARWFGLYALCVALGAYTHLTLVFMALAHAAVCAWLTFGPHRHRRIRDWRLPVIAFGGGALLTIALYLPMLDEVLWWFLHRPSNLVGASTPSWALVEGLRVLALGAGLHTGVLLGAAAVFLAGLASFWRRDPAIVGLFMLPAVATLAGALLTRGTMYPRFFFYLAGFLLLIAVRGALVTGGWLGGRLLPARHRDRRELIGWAMVGVMIFGTARSLGYNYRYPKQDFAATVAWLDEARRGGEDVVIAGASYVYTDYYRRDWPVLADVGALDSLRRDGRGLWAVYMQPRYIELAAPGLVAAIEEACVERRTFHGTVGGGDIIVCRIAPLRP
jgi:mannosyltransferase